MKINRDGRIMFMVDLVLVVIVYSNGGMRRDDLHAAALTIVDRFIVRSSGGC